MSDETKGGPAGSLCRDEGGPIWAVAADVDTYAILLVNGTEARWAGIAEDRRDVLRWERAAAESGCEAIAVPLYLNLPDVDGAAILDRLSAEADVVVRQATFPVFDGKEDVFDGLAEKFLSRQKT